MQAIVGYDQWNPRKGLSHWSPWENCSAATGKSVMHTHQVATLGNNGPLEVRRSWMLTKLKEAAGSNDESEPTLSRIQQQLQELGDELLDLLEGT